MQECFVMWLLFFVKQWVVGEKMDQVISINEDFLCQDEIFTRKFVDIYLLKDVFV